MYKTNKIKSQVPYFFLGKLTCILVIMIAIFLMVLFVLPERTASAGNTTGGTYTITSVKIEEGDSLWSIANEYYTDEFSSISAYIDSYILVPQYVLN